MPTGALVVAHAGPGLGVKSVIRDDEDDGGLGNRLEQLLQARVYPPVRPWNHVAQGVDLGRRHAKRQVPGAIVLPEAVARDVDGPEVYGEERRPLGRIERGRSFEEYAIGHQR